MAGTIFILLQTYLIMAIEFVNPPAISAVTYHMKEVSFMDDIQSNEHVTDHASHAQAKAAMLDEATALVRS